MKEGIRLYSQIVLHLSLAINESIERFLTSIKPNALKTIFSWIISESIKT